MRYTKQALEIINKFKHDMEPIELQEYLVLLGFRLRSIKSIQAKLSYYFQLEKDLKAKKQKEYRIQYATSNPISYRASTLLNGARSRAKKKGLECTLTLEWVKERVSIGRCPITNAVFEIKPYSENGHLEDTSPFAPSIDRIDPSIGYIPSNSQVVINAYNKFKSTYSIADTVRIAKNFVDYRRTKHSLVAE